MALSLGLTLSDLDNLTVGMVESMIIEANNDLEEYNLKPLQEDFDRFAR